MFQRFETLLPPFPAGEPRTAPTGFFAFLWACTDGVRWAIMTMALLTAMMAAFDTLLIAMLGRVVDWLAVTSPEALWSERRGDLLLFGGVLVLSIGLVALQTLVRHQVIAINLPMRMRWNFHRLMLGQSMAFYQDEFAGRISTKVLQTALAVRDTLFMTAELLVSMSIHLITIVILVGTFDLGLIVPFLVWMVCYALATAWFVPRLGRIGKAQADARSVMTGRINDAYTNIATVKLFSHGQREAAFARSAMQEFMAPGYGQMRLVSAFEIVNHALAMGLTMGMAGTALWLWSRGSIGVGAVAAATAMALRLQTVSSYLMWQVSSLFESVGTVQDGINTLSRPPAVVDRPDARDLVVTGGEIRFEDVRFAYGAGRPPVFDGLSFTVRPGERIGLVGRSGAGKSTLVNLLLRFHDVERGTIRIDGQDISHVTQDSLRAAVGMVTQDTSLLHRSLAENMAYGRPDADEAQIRAAARRAEAEGFIDGLSDPQGRQGLAAHVGERGVKLSGGQRQRVAIARVMLKDAPILLLDEATSALDSEAEAAIQSSLDELMRGKTVIAIAHRLSTIAAMDRLLVLEAGRIVEEGDHRTLLAQGGIYARLWQRQSGGFLGED